MAMCPNWKAGFVLALIPVLSLQLAATAQGSPAGSLTSREARQLEHSGKTAADHLRLADYYRLRARKSEQKLADAREQMKQSGSLAYSTKVPNSYTMARNNADRYSADLEKYSKLVAQHESAAKSLDAGGTLIR
jgi:hypothetical protein